MLKLCEQNIKNLLPCEPFKVKESKIVGKDLHIYYEFCGRHEVCPECGEPFQIHQWREIVLLGPPFGLHQRSFWHVKYCVYECRECSYFKTQDIPFRFENTGCTTCLAKMICDDLSIQNETVKNVARRYSLKWDRVKNIHKAYLRLLEQTVPVPEGPEIAAVDEFSTEKRHRYATFVINAKTKYPLYLHKGNSAEDFRPFFVKYGEDFYSGIKAFAMDQNASYSSVVKEYLPSCAIVCDYFHLILNYNEQVIAKVQDRTMRNARLMGDIGLFMRLKGSSRLLMKRLSDKDWEAGLALRNLMEENRELDICIHMRTLLQNMYDHCDNEQSMRDFWRKWCQMAKESCIPELMHFAQTKKRHENEILNHAKYAISSGVIEGCMNKIKVLKRVAFGFRDWDYFFLRVWNAFLPNEIKNKYSDQIWQNYDCDDGLGGIA